MMTDKDIYHKIKNCLNQLSSPTMSTLIESDPDYKAAAQAVDQTGAECRRLFEKGSKEWEAVDAYYDGLCQLCLETGDLSYLAGILDSYKVLQIFCPLMRNTTAGDAQGLHQYMVGKEPAPNDLMEGFRLGVMFHTEMMKNPTE